MTKTSRILQFLLVVALLGWASSPALAASCPLITVDENGNGTLDFTAGGGCGAGVSVPLPGVLAADPGPGGLASVLTYNLLGPPSLTAGDVLVNDPADGLTDVVRFNPAGTGSAGYAASLLVYSAPLDGFDSLADTPSPPGSFYTNNLTVTESVVDGISFIIYTPATGQPGFVPGFSVTYDVISDTPEPCTLMLLGSGLFALVGPIRRKLKV